MKLNDNLQSEIDKVKSYHANTEQGLRAQLDQLVAKKSGNDEWKLRYEDMRHENEELQRELQEQKKVTDEVRQEASGFLNEMKAISNRSGQNWEREEMLGQQVSRLEDEVKEWKSRYARTKVQLRTLRAGSMGLSIHQPDAAQHAKDGGLTRQDGLVRDVHVTKFQIAIDEVLRVARVAEPQTVLDYMKHVVAAVRNICEDINETVSPHEDLEQHKLRARLRANVSATANNFITASKNFAQSHGISPISLLDAAASHLAAAVVELIRTVKIKPTPAGESGDDDDGNLPPGSTEYFSATNGRASTADSVYSSHTSMQQISPPQLANNSYQPSSKHARKYSAALRSVSKNGMPNGKASEVVPRVGYGTKPRDIEVDDLKVRRVCPYTATRQN